MPVKIKSTFLKSYSFSLVLIGSILLGSLLGIIFKQQAVFFKPFGDIFLNLLFTIVVPMVFFSLSSAVAAMTDGKRLGKILAWMMMIFTLTGILASVVMIIGVKLYPPAVGITLDMATKVATEHPSLPQQIVGTFTVADFPDLLSKRNMLALILFSILTGVAASSVGEKGKAFTQFLVSANEVMAKALDFIMWYAPIGLGAYFAYLVGVFGPQLLGAYFRAMVLYYPVTLVYFFLAFSLYAFLAGRTRGLRAFWGNIIPTSLTAWATGSSVATIPMNLEAAEEIGVPRDVRELVIPIGATIHMEGSCLAAVLKLALLCGLFNVPFAGPETLIKTVGVAVICGMVVSGIPGGGLLGELLIINLYGFPIEALPIITLIGTLVDPAATMVNAVGDNVSSMMVARVLEGPKWMGKPANS